ncbi:hypothetical protein Cph01nite_26260 [Cellulomonas phragmiteti]|uniref:Uncharacterized protein n=2 Tax=Cellulomonas phragmiteti TaxID=478780 RepID=A0ABQ4DNE5_9CELL|nr:hypothetical protein Cph01nite_26260 [Cellulomonas phragmiteti]
MEDVPGTGPRRHDVRTGPQEEDDMGLELWGPALDAELAYRRESVADEVRRGRVPAIRRARRRWWLLGSGMWHTAR